jgi:NAD(P)-dependent dehydrogenase (short-subunit alcohol dehydrogenase family)
MLIGQLMTFMSHNDKYRVCCSNGDFEPGLAIPLRPNAATPVKFSNRAVVVTGAGAGLGACIAGAAAQRGARRVVVADRCEETAEQVARDIGGLAVVADLSTEAGVADVVAAAKADAGVVDIWIANAGTGEFCDPFTDDAVFDRMWRLHVMSQVWAARALIPDWLACGAGHFAAVVSANALTTNPTSMAYAITKHAQLVAVEWLAMTYSTRGIAATAFCPKGMRTPLLLEHAKTNAYAATALADAVTPEEAAAVFIGAIETDQTIAYTHPAVLDQARLRLDDHAEYIRQLQRLHDLVPQVGVPR